MAKREYTSIGRLREQHGSMAFLVCAVVLPIIFFLFSLTIDLEAYYRETERTQKAADSAALYASRFLPFSTQAVNAAKSYLNSFGHLGTIANVQADRDYLSIEINDGIELNFPQLLGVHVRVPVTAYAKTRTTPLDIFLAMDTSPYMAPSLVGGSRWGDSGDWSAAQFFTALKPELNSNPIDPVIATEQCFNPAFSALKQATIASYDYLSTFSLNQLGLGFFPGSVNDLDVVREIVPGGARSLTSPPSNGGEADFVPYVTLVNNDSYCAAASEQETANPRYTMPTFAGALGSQWALPDGHPSSMVIPGTWEFDAAYQTSLRARDVIWSRVVKVNFATNLVPKTDQVMSNLFSRLIAPPIGKDRGGLNASALKKGIIIAGDVPWVGFNRFLSANDGVTTPLLGAALSNMRQQAQDNKINAKLYYVILHSDFSPPELRDRAIELQSFFDQFAFKQEEPPSSFAAKVILADSPEELSTRLVGQVMIDSKTGMISK